MNAIALFVMLVLKGNPTCAAESASQTTMGTTAGAQPVEVQRYNCYWRGENIPSHQFVVVSPVCPSYVGEPILLEEMHERKGWVRNRFGEFYPASVNLEMMDIYKPACG